MPVYKGYFEVGTIQAVASLPISFSQLELDALMLLAADKNLSIEAYVRSRLNLEPEPPGRSLLRATSKYVHSDPWERYTQASGLTIKMKTGRK